MEHTHLIDRMGPTLRPPRRASGRQARRRLLFMHWPVPEQMLRELVPAALELDLHDGVAYVGVVPFEMEGVRPRWWPPALAFNFLETNVRTYVVRGDQPGVYFFSLEAASRLAVWVGCGTFWGLPYHYAEMQVKNNEDTIYYQSVRQGEGIRHQVRYRVGEMLGPSLPDTIEFFFLERYLLFVERRDGMYVGQVHHTPYPGRRHTCWKLPMNSSRPPVLTRRRPTRIRPLCSGSGRRSLRPAACLTLKSQEHHLRHNIETRLEMSHAAIRVLIICRMLVAQR